MDTILSIHVFSALGRPTLTLSSRYAFTSTEQSTRTTSSDLLSMLFLSVDQLLVHQDPRYFRKASFGGHFLDCNGVWDYSSLHAELGICLCWTAWDSCRPIFLAVTFPLNGNTAIKYMQSHTQHIYTQLNPKKALINYCLSTRGPRKCLRLPPPLCN